MANWRAKPITYCQGIKFVSNKWYSRPMIFSTRLKRYRKPCGVIPNFNLLCKYDIKKPLRPRNICQYFYSEHKIMLRRGNKT